MAINWNAMVKNAAKAYQSAQNYGAARNYNIASKQFSQQLGLDTLLKSVKGYGQQALKSQGRLNALEGNVGKRISGMGLNEAERQRMYSAERVPLAKQYSDLMSAQNIATQGYNQAKDRYGDLMAAWEKRRQSSIDRRLAPYESFKTLAPLYEKADNMKPATTSVAKTSSGTGSYYYPSTTGYTTPTPVKTVVKKVSPKKKTISNYIGGKNPWAGPTKSKSKSQFTW
jgi:hypothetical protein